MDFKSLKTIEAVDILLYFSNGINNVSKINFLLFIADRTAMNFHGDTITTGKYLMQLLNKNMLPLHRKFLVPEKIMQIDFAGTLEYKDKDLNIRFLNNMEIEILVEVLATYGTLPMQELCKTILSFSEIRYYSYDERDRTTILNKENTKWSDCIL